MTTNAALPPYLKKLPCGDGWIDLLSDCQEDMHLYCQRVSSVLDCETTIGYEAMCELQRFYPQLRQSMPTALLYRSNMVAMYNQYLPDLFRKYNIQDKEYARQNQWRALFGSLIIQHKVHLELQQNPSYFQCCLVECKLFVQKIGNPMASRGECLLAPFARPLELPEDNTVEMESFTRFFVAAKLACEAFGHIPRWERLAMLLCCLSTGENCWFCAGGGESVWTNRRRHVFHQLHAYYYASHHRTIVQPRLKGSSKRKKAAAAPAASVARKRTAAAHFLPTEEKKGGDDDEDENSSTWDIEQIDEAIEKLLKDPDTIQEHDDLFQFSLLAYLTKQTFL